jgi:REP element-mobilizing transposase RayT
MAAYLITFTCYGSYIPGQQGAIDREHNVPGSRLPSPRPKLRQHVDASLKQAPFEMDHGQRAIVLKAIGEVCRYRRWHLLAAHVRSNHVHSVVEAGVAPEAVMNAFKSYASRALNLHAPGDHGRLRWARHGSTRYLWSAERVAAAVRYVLDQQGDSMAWYQASERS